VEFLATPPAWQKPPPHSDDGARDLFSDCLPKTLFDDIQTSSCPEFTETNSFDSYTPSVFVVDGINELESRLIQIYNVHPETTREDLVGVFASYGDIDVIDVSNVALGIASVKFCDLQAALQARYAKLCIRGKNLLLTFGPQDPVENPRKPPNNGTIVVFHLRNGVTDDQIRGEFSKFGEIRQIRSAPGKQSQRFVEYWDIRSAHRALKKMRGKRVFDSKISVEFSLPGGHHKLQMPTTTLRLPTIERVSHCR
jgi:RNA recognition motif-containing protein